MSLLLEALKKAAIEKQRQMEKDGDSFPDQELAEPPFPDAEANTREPAPNNWQAPTEGYSTENIDSPNFDFVEKESELSLLDNSAIFNDDSNHEIPCLEDVEDTDVSLNTDSSIDSDSIENDTSIHNDKPVSDDKDYFSPQSYIQSNIDIHKQVNESRLDTLSNSDSEASTTNAINDDDINDIQSDIKNSNELNEHHNDSEKFPESISAPKSLDTAPELSVPNNTENQTIESPSETQDKLKATEHADNQHAKPETQNQKEAFSVLLNAGHKNQRTVNKRRMFFLGGLFTCGIGLMGAYYYQLKHVDQSSAFSVPGFNAPEANTVPNDSEAQISEHALEADANITESESSGSGTIGSDAMASKNLDTDASNSDVSTSEITESKSIGSTTVKAEITEPEALDTMETQGVIVSSNSNSGTNNTPKNTPNDTVRNLESIAIKPAHTEAKPIRPAQPKAKAALIAKSVEKSTLKLAPTRTSAPKPKSTQKPDPASRPINIVSEQTLVTRAYNAYQQGALTNAKENYIKALANNPNNTDGLLGLAAIAMKQGESIKALEYFQKVLQIAPNNSIAQVGIASLMNNASSTNGAAQINTLLNEQPNAHFLYYSRGTIAARAKDWNNAQRDFLKAMQLQPSADYAFNLGIAYDHLGQKAQALATYQRALALSRQNEGSFSLPALVKRIEQLSVKSFP